MNDAGAEAPAKKNPEAVTFVIPISALAHEAGIEPGPGDTVDIMGEAKVVSMRDGKATLTLLRVNDSPVTDGDAAEDLGETPEGPDDEAGLAEEARKLDAKKYM
jgi:hypothetical protein